MLKQLATVTTTLTQEVILKPSLRRKFTNALNTYAGIAAQLAVLEAQKAASKVQLEALMAESEEEKLDIDGFSVTLVFPVRSKLDKKLFVQQGGTLAQLDNATVSTPSKHYLLITVPGQKERVYEE